MRTRIQNATIVNEGKRFVGTVTLEDDKILSIVPSDDTIHPSADRPRDRCRRVVPDTGRDRRPCAFPRTGTDPQGRHRHRKPGGGGRRRDVVHGHAERRAADHHSRSPGRQVPVGSGKEPRQLFFLLRGHPYEHRHAGTTGPAQGMWRQTVHGKQHGQYARRPRRRATRHIQPLPPAHHDPLRRLVHHIGQPEIVPGTVWRRPDVKYHPAIRNEEACFRSTELAVKLARETGARLHVAHVSTARELSLFRRDPLWDETTGRMKPVTAEACIAHLFYTDADYARLGTRIKCNPAIKSGADRAALRQALTDGRIDVIGTDHAPHLPVEKEGGCVKAASGMPMVQFSLVSMLRLADEGVLPLERVVDLMCHAPARLFQIKGRGFLREGAQADLVLLRPSSPWTLRKEDILSRCGWSPLEGETFNWSVEQTYCNGHLVYNHGHIDTDVCGRQLTFDR